MLAIVESALPPPAKVFLLKFQDVSVLVRSADKQQESDIFLNITVNFNFFELKF